MRIPWWRATPEGIEPYVFPVFCFTNASAIVVNVIATALAIVGRSYWHATTSSGCAALSSGLLLWGVHQARQQELWRTRIEHDIEASSHQASMLRLQRDRLTRDIGRYTAGERRH
jgi:hypothetical protein